MSSAGGPAGFAAVVLAGGAGRRLGGVDKPAQRVGGRALLERVLDAVAEAEQRVVVGPVRTTGRAVSWTREEPAGAGPVAALAAGLAAVQAPVVIVLAADLPFLSTAAVGQLLHPVRLPGTAPGTVLLDDSGAPQWLVSCWRADLLRSAVAGGSGSLKSVMAPLRPVPVRVAGLTPPPWYDCDTPADLARAAEWTEASR